ncbi:hypothetical protein QBD01_000163 [Ochrobactrum sp. 19YEA23]|nr:hypothetical protein [Ochrobactrum sp. 19YEA23]
METLPGADQRPFDLVVLVPIAAPQQTATDERFQNNHTGCRHPILRWTGYTTIYRDEV